MHTVIHMLVSLTRLKLVTLQYFTVKGLFSLGHKHKQKQKLKRRLSK